MLPEGSTRLSPQQRERFERDGCLHPLRVLDDAEVSRFSSLYMAFNERNRERIAALPARRRFEVTSQMHFVFPWVYEIVTHPRILDAVEGVLGPNILAWDTNWFTKMPGDKTYVSWHQDGTYWNLTPPTVVTAWVALTPSRSENGCMRVVPGTHKVPFMPQRETYADDNALSRGQEIAVAVEEEKAVDLSLNPGEMSLHHIWIVHGSNANQSSTPRVGIAIRYVRPEVVQDSPGKPLALLVRGKDTHGNFDLRPAPTPETEARGAEAQAEIVARIRASLMKNATPKP